MTKNHLKSRAAPRTWNIPRKMNTFITRPNPGSQSLEMTLPLSTVLRDLKVGNTSKELNFILKSTPVLVNGVRRHDLRFGVGFMDVLAIPSVKIYAILTMDAKGRLAMHAIDEKASSSKLAQVRGASKIPGNKLVIHTTDGRSIPASKPIARGSTVAISIPKQAIMHVYAVEPKAHVILTSGKHRGKRGTVTTIDNDHITIALDGTEISTKAAYAFALGGAQ